MAEIMRAELEAAINSGSAEVLRASIQKAHPGDVDVSVLNLAHQVLVREDHKASACEKLRKACETRNSGELVSAIHLAKAFDADAALIEVAESILAEERTKDIAKQRLHCAAQLRNARHLRAEIAACISCGMDKDDPEIGKVQTLLAELEEEERQQTESRRLVEERLRAAMSGGSAEELRVAIDAASKASLEVSLLNEAHLALVMRERQHRQVMQTLANAVKARNCAALEEAIAEATKHEVDDSLLKDAREALAQEQEKGFVEGELDQAMQAKDIGALKAAVAKATEAGVRQDKLIKAKEMLDESSRRGSARERLDELLQMESPDVSELRAALQDAREAGCEVAMINTAYTRLAIQERRTQAEAALAMALQQRDRIELHKAIAIAEGSGASESSVAEAREALAVMERKADVCSRIRSAINSGIMGYLEVAVREGREAGLQEELPESSLLAEAELALKKLQESHAAAEGEAAASESVACPLAEAVAPAVAAAAPPEEEAAVTKPGQEDSQAEAEGLEEDDDTITVDVRVWHQCPSCSGLFGSTEAVRAHWLRVHRPGARAAEVSETPAASVGGATNGAVPAAKPSSGSPSGVELPSVAQSSSPSSSPPADSGSPTKKQKCPSCDAIFDTVEEARAHWLQQHHSQAKAAGTAAGQASSPQPAMADSNKGEVIVACDETGKAVVVRKVDEETKASFTVVLDEDGMEKKFGEKTVQSMADSVEDQVWAWLGKMSRWQLRGVAHEVTQRVMEGSQRYHSKRENLQKLSQRYNLVYFGLSSDATEKDLDAAYRRMAKTLHPDKHGGSEAAKERFQKMKARYEHLKQSMSGSSNGGGKSPAKSGTKSGGGGSSRKAEEKEEEDKNNAKSPEQQETEEQASKDSGDRAEEATGEEQSEGANEESDSRGPSGASPGGAARREAYDEDEEPRNNAQDEEEEEDVLQCDFNNRASVEKMVWKMLRQIKNIKNQEATLDAELRVYEGAMKSWATS